jgi:hypothetical protein
MRKFSFNCPQEVIGLGYSLAYQFVAALSSDMMIDLAKVVSFPTNEDIAAL